MEYIDVEWIHKDSAYPVRLVSELDERRHETRKLEFFPRGEVGYASQHQSAHGTELSLEPIPPLAEINQSPEFRGAYISAKAFEVLWAANAPDGA